MASFMNRVQEFARSPRGRKVVEQAKQAANDPANREKVRSALRRFQSRRTPPPGAAR